MVFRLHPSSQDSLQKTRQFVCQFAVPRGFRGDYVQLTCTAVGTNRGAVRSLDSEVTAGVARYTVGIYLEGDAVARQAADLLAQRQEELAHLVLQQADLARRNKAPAWWHTVSKTMMNVSHDQAVAGGCPAGRACPSGFEHRSCPASDSPAQWPAGGADDGWQQRVAGGYCRPITSKGSPWGLPCCGQHVLESISVVMRIGP